MHGGATDRRFSDLTLSDKCITVFKVTAGLAYVGTTQTQASENPCTRGCAVNLAKSKYVFFPNKLIDKKIIS